MIVYCHICKGILYFRICEVPVCQNSIILRISQRTLTYQILLLSNFNINKILLYAIYTYYKKIFQYYTQTLYIVIETHNVIYIYLFLNSAIVSLMRLRKLCFFCDEQLKEIKERTKLGRDPASSITNEHIDIYVCILLCIKESNRKT